MSSAGRTPRPHGGRAPSGAVPVRHGAPPPSIEPVAVVAPTLDHGSFDDFYRAEHRRVVAIVRSLTGDQGTAEDVTQEAFATALRKWDTIRDYERPADWVRRVAVNKAISRFRRRRTEADALTRLGTAGGVAAEPTVADEALWDAVRALPKRQRQVVALVYVDDRSLDDVAAILGCSTGTVKSHLHRARQTLAARLDRAGEDRR